MHKLIAVGFCDECSADSHHGLRCKQIKVPEFGSRGDHGVVLVNLQKFNVLNFDALAFLGK